MNRWQKTSRSSTEKKNRQHRKTHDHHHWHYEKALTTGHQFGFFFSSRSDLFRTMSRRSHCSDCNSLFYSLFCVASLCFCCCYCCSVGMPSVDYIKRIVPSASVCLLSEWLLSYRCKSFARMQKIPKWWRPTTKAMHQMQKKKTLKRNEEKVLAVATVHFDLRLLFFFSTGFFLSLLVSASECLAFFRCTWPKFFFLVLFFIVRREDAISVQLQQMPTGKTVENNSRHQPIISTPKASSHQFWWIYDLSTWFRMKNNKWTKSRLLVAADDAAFFRLCRVNTKLFLNARPYEYQPRSGQANRWSQMKRMNENEKKTKTKEIASAFYTTWMQIHAQQAATEIMKFHFVLKSLCVLPFAHAFFVPI